MKHSVKAETQPDRCDFLCLISFEFVICCYLNRFSYREAIRIY
nr:MAG TPA: hypothetical protein [Caudoviricetes sp.]